MSARHGTSLVLAPRSSRQVSYSNILVLAPRSSRQTSSVNTQDYFIKMICCKYIIVHIVYLQHGGFAGLLVALNTSGNNEGKS
jgi:hypothetical protein